MLPEYNADLRQALPLARFCRQKSS